MASCACDRPIRNFESACAACVESIRDRLDELVDLLADLDDAVTRQSRPGRSGPYARSGPREQPLPFDDAASEMTRTVRRVMSAWAFDFSSAFPALPVAPVPTPVARAHWLADHPVQLARYSEASALLGAMADLVDRVRRMVDRRSDDRTVFARCACGQPVAGSPLATTIVCRGCGTAHDVEEMQVERTGAVVDLVATASELLANWRSWSPRPISRPTVFRLTGWLVPVDHKGPRGAARFRVVDVVTAASARSRAA